MHIRATTLVGCTMLAAFASSQTFKQPCSKPKFPAAATAIDDQCGASGSAAADSPDGLQNSRKNDFCADSQPTAITAAVLKKLQGDTETAQRRGHVKPGTPPKNRAFLEKLGEGDLVTFEGFVFRARQECKETVNCETVPPNTDTSHDIHISLLDHQRTSSATSTPATQDAEECTSFVAEMIPHHRSAEWTACNVNDIATQNLRVRITGQRFFDGSHLPCVGKKPNGSNPKRSSLWEIHPIYTFEVCPKGDCAGGGWTPLETFAKGKTTCENKPCEDKPAKKTP